MAETIAVVGAGAVGLTAAYDLARAGERVTVYRARRGRRGKHGTSRRRAVRRLRRGSGRKDRPAFDRAVPGVFGEASFEFHETPYLWFAHEGDRKRATAIREQVPRMQAHGIEAELLDSEELAEVAPTIATEGVAVAALARNTGWTEPTTYAELLAEKARGAGAEIRTETPVSLSKKGVRIESHEEAFETVIVAAGAHTKGLVEAAGYGLAMKPYRVQALVLDTEIETPMGYDATAGFYFRPHPKGLLVGDGTEDVESDPDEWDRESDEEFVASALERAGERFGLSEPKVERAWVGLCTATPDGNPLTGWLSEDLYVATGWQGHGFMRAPATGELIAREVCGASGIEPFRPTRFSGEEAFPIIEGMAL